jgi:hypothetical protein
VSIKEVDFTWNSSCDILSVRSGEKVGRPMEISGVMPAFTKVVLKIILTQAQKINHVGVKDVNN